jgi:hypothetical protein
MRAILVSVDYADILALTLPLNRHHFSDVMVVTTPKDFETLHVATANECRTHVTDSFYADGAVFNKWRALEEGLDQFGRRGLLCIMDADVLWPKLIPKVDPPQGTLMSPLRRMMEQVTLPLPLEQHWDKYPIHRNVNEWAGYTQIFWANDPALGHPPWHDVKWSHAGGADSFFQQKWHASKKIRPPWECLHLGPAGANWYGRASAYLDQERLGATPASAGEKARLIAAMWAKRRRLRAEGRDQFEGERIGETRAPQEPEEQL